MNDLSTQVGMLEAEITKLNNKVEQERRRNDMQAGALRESRAENDRLLRRNEDLAASNATYAKHFYDFHGSADRIDKQAKELAAQLEPAVAELVNSPQAIVSIKDRVARLISGDAA